VAAFDEVVRQDTRIIFARWADVQRERIAILRHWSGRASPVVAASTTLQSAPAPVKGQTGPRGSVL
jgi:hypothetical protein